VLKQRYWWQCGTEENFASDCDFIWTAWKKNKHIEFLANVDKEHKGKQDAEVKKKQMEEESMDDL
jgi:hypothetical protein